MSPDEGTDAHTGTATCYRHPDREAPIRCTRCGRPICLDDAVDAPVGYLCPEDARSPAQRRAVRAGRPTATMTLVGAVVVVFLLQQATGQVFQRGALFGPLVADGQWWRIVTAGFLHANLLHIGFNAYLLYLLGQMLEPGIGTGRFLAVFTAGLAGGSAGALALSWGATTVGASGAVFGLMGAAMIGLRRRGINPWQTSIGTLVILNLVFTFAAPGISIGGHLGGIAGGALAALPVFATGRERSTTGLAGAWGIAGALLVAAVVAGVAGPLV